ncbi:2'-5' RNA ligase superfamily protein [Diaminobutyricimonas aerilata]|uniref:2'-5' RNA ligase superfamily protein n=1 Tax=Diaminobutyricimonas aerilata TaxID=1162967 RepID=A0A2M9CFJ6_9MICO|nr:2'-5' RNA ligase family protein [Diaminobutyricimonas aerilata]PJJ70716.1 2'-5' RNA ligase superfamily protein [Diaminobutyricimonas aerilata]
MPRPFMTDPAQLAALEGQQYVVFRPIDGVLRAYEAARRAVAPLLPTGATHPHAGHVTLRGFHEPRRVESLKNFIADWAAEQTPVTMNVDTLDGFPPPFRVAILRLARSPSLVDAYASLTHALERTDFARVGELPVDDWIFHMSVAYCGDMPDDRWSELHRTVTDSPLRSASEVLSEIEFVWYEQGEHRETFALDG